MGKIVADQKTKTIKKKAEAYKLPPSVTRARASGADRTISDGRSREMATLVLRQEPGT